MAARRVRVHVLPGRRRPAAAGTGAFPVPGQDPGGAQYRAAYIEFHELSRRADQGLSCRYPGALRGIMRASRPGYSLPPG